MRLTKNPEIARLLVRLLVTLAVFLLLAAIGVSISLRMYTEPLLTQQAALIGAVIERYPEAEQDLIRQLAEVDIEAVRQGEAVLSRYGYGEDQLVLGTRLMQSQSRVQTWLYLSMAVSIFAVLTTIFFIFIRRRYQTVIQLRDYTRDIADGRVTLDIRDNGEGDFSILKNQIYTIMTILKERTEALQREKINLSDSIADISHQLKTPMTSLSVMTDLLLDDSSPEMRAEFLGRIRSQLDRLEWLVSSLLKLSRLDAGAVAMKRESFPASKLIERVLDTLSIPLEIKQQQVSLHGEEDVLVTGDLEWTAEALINILKNAIEHTPEQGKIRIEWEANPIFTRITIADNGAGIEAKDLPHIFTRFYKGKNAGDDSVGIGLAMAQAIVRQQNGDIAVNSAPGLGTTFIITFYKQHI